MKRVYIYIHTYAMSYLKYFDKKGAWIYCGQFFFPHSKYLLLKFKKSLLPLV